MSAIAGTARARSSHVPYLLRWSDPARRITVEFLTEVLIEAVEGCSTGILLQGMVTEGRSRTWTALFSEPLLPADARTLNTDFAAAGPADLSVIGVVVPEAQRDSVLAELTASRMRLPSTLLLVSVRADTAAVALLNAETGEAAALLEFPSSIERLVRAKFRPFERVSMASKQQFEEPRSTGESPPADRGDSPADQIPASESRRRLPLTGFRFAHWMWAVLVLVIAAALWSPIRSRIVTTGQSGDAPQARDAVSGFGIQASRQENNLEIRWDRTLPSIQSAVSGVLKITDGGQRFAIPLTKKELEAGQILYPFRSKSLALELVIETPSGSESESVRVILADGEFSGVRTRVVERAAVRRTSAPPPPISEEPEPEPQRARMALPPQFSAPAPRQRDLLLVPPPAVEVAAGTPVLPLRSTFLANPTAMPAPPSSVQREAGPRVNNGGVQRTTAPPAGGTQEARDVVTRPSEVKNASSTPLRPVMFEAPVPLRQSTPRVPNALRHAIFNRVTIEVKVAIDPSGNVVSAVTEPYSGVAGHLAEIAKETARGWKFQPGRRNGQPVMSDFLIRFTFGRNR